MSCLSEVQVNELKTRAIEEFLQKDIDGWIPGDFIWSHYLRGKCDEVSSIVCRIAKEEYNILDEDNVVIYGLIRFNFGDKENPRTGGDAHPYNVINGRIVDATFDQFYDKYSVTDIFNVEYFKEDGLTPYDQ